MDVPFLPFAENGPLAATLLADAFLEQTWLATAPETWFASPLIVVFTCAFAMAMKQGAAPHQALERMTAIVRTRLDARAGIALALRELKKLSGARGVLVALEGASAPMLLSSEAAEHGGRLATRTLRAAECGTYFFAPPAPTVPSGSISKFEVPGTRVPAGFREAHEFDHLVGFALHTPEWDCRLFLLDPASDSAAGSARVEFVRLLRQLVPAVARVSDLHAQRHRAEARERARIGRELHDGVVQELTCVDMELESIRVGVPRDAGIRERIGRIQDRLRAELKTLRKLLQDACFRDIDASRLEVVLAGLVERFGRDNRMHADYVSRVTEVRLPPNVCGEIARIVQEALVNVRRHSGAHHVTVTFSCDNADWKLSIEDDGRGFHSGRHGSTDANAPAAVPPAVIYERVHALGGSVRVVAPGPSGARIEISARQRDLWNRTA
jgi:signal transduction histidine kinase